MVLAGIGATAPHPATASVTKQQPTQQVRVLDLPRGPLPVLRQPLLHLVEQRLLHQCRHAYADPLLLGATAEGSLPAAAKAAARLLRFDRLALLVMGES